MQYLLLYHGSSGYENAPVTFIRTLPHLFSIWPSVLAREVIRSKMRGATIKINSSRFLCWIKLPSRLSQFVKLLTCLISWFYSVWHLGILDCIAIASCPIFNSLFTVTELFGPTDIGLSYWQHVVKEQHVLQWINKYSHTRIARFFYIFVIIVECDI
jgi:hypothetical protein